MPAVPVATACGCSAVKVCFDTAVGAMCTTLPVAAPLAPLIVPGLLIAGGIGFVVYLFSDDSPSPSPTTSR